MWVKQVLLLLIFIFVKCECASTRIYFSKCGYGGFSCQLTNGKYKITYQCPAGVNDITFYLWDFKTLSNTESVVIKNCTNLKLSFQCTEENKPIEHLLIANITNLVIVKTFYTLNPYTVIFENIENLEYIPENGFYQMQIPRGRCKNPFKPFQNLYFNRVNIGTVAFAGFKDLQDFHNFSWNEVQVKRLQYSAVQLQLGKGGEFSVMKSNVEVSEHLGFQIIGPKALFAENKFVDLSPGAINGTLETFIFNNNNVTNLQSYGISVLAENVKIKNNHFEYLKAGAFVKIGPGLLESTQRRLGNLKFTYEFNHNIVNFMDSASLNPDVEAYSNVVTELSFNENSFLCSCENLGWLLSDIGYGYNSDFLHDFYETIVNEEHKNTCSYTSCGLHLPNAKKLVDNGRCLTNRTAENLCTLIKDKSKATEMVNAKLKVSFSLKSETNILRQTFCHFLVIIVMSRCLILIITLNNL